MLRQINEEHWYIDGKFAQLITFDGMNIPGLYLTRGWGGARPFQ